MKFFVLCLWVSVLSAAVLPCQAAGHKEQISVSDQYFLDDLIQNPQNFTEISRQELLTALQEGDLVDIGESHETGLERDYIAELYTDLAQVLKPAPEQCLVESGSLKTGSNGPVTHVSLIPAPDKKDPVTEAFSKVCESKQIQVNPVDDYTDLLKKYLGKGRVLTHTGLRHMLPFGLIYSKDFLNPGWVDQPPTGTIDRQLPNSFLTSGKQMRSHANLALEDLALPQLQGEIIASLEADQTPSEAAQNTADKISQMINSPVLQFRPDEEAHIFEIKRVNESFPFQKAYMSLLNHPAFSLQLLKTLIASPEALSFLKTVDPKTVMLGVYIPSEKEAIEIMGPVTLSEPGTIYLTARAKDGSKDVAVTISPKQGPKLF